MAAAQMALAPDSPRGRLAGPRGLDPASRLAAADGLAALRVALHAGPVEFRAWGVSMRPLLRAGDRVRLEDRAPRRGDIALLTAGSRLVLHRLVRRRGTFWLPRGDARWRDDGWVGAGQILGVVTARRARPGERGHSAWRRLNRRRDRWLGLTWARIARLARAL